MAHLSGDNRKLLGRVRRLKGQLEGIERMLEAGEDCYRILQTTAACRGALNALTRELINEHIEHHLTGDPSASESVKGAAREIQDILASYLK
jgi:DNA-binding FrmR family transcriptional regulator